MFGYVFIPSLSSVAFHSSGSAKLTVVAWECSGVRIRCWRGERHGWKRICITLQVAVR